MIILGTVWLFSYSIYSYWWWKTLFLETLELHKYTQLLRQRGAHWNHARYSVPHQNACDEFSHPPHCLKFSQRTKESEWVSSLAIDFSITFLSEMTIMLFIWLKKKLIWTKVVLGLSLDSRSEDFKTTISCIQTTTGDISSKCCNKVIRGSWEGKYIYPTLDLWAGEENHALNHVRGSKSFRSHLWEDLLPHPWCEFCTWDLHRDHVSTFLATSLVEDLSSRINWVVHLWLDWSSFLIAAIFGAEVWIPFPPDQIWMRHLLACNGEENIATMELKWEDSTGCTQKQDPAYFYLSVYRRHVYFNVHASRRL